MEAALAEETGGAADLLQSEHNNLQSSLAGEQSRCTVPQPQSWHFSVAVVGILHSLRNEHGPTNGLESELQKHAKHDRHSHIADALRTLATGLKDYTNIRTVRTLQKRNRPNNIEKNLIQNDWDPFNI